MRGYYDLVRTRQSSLFILLGWNIVLVETLRARSMYLVLVEDDTGVLGLMQCSLLKPYSATTNLTVCQ